MRLKMLDLSKIVDDIVTIDKEGFYQSMISTEARQSS